MAKEENIKTVTLSFQEYEIENIIKILDNVIFYEYIRREIFWKKLKNQTTDDKIKKQLKFTQKSINRQLENIKDKK